MTYIAGCRIRRRRGKPSPLPLPSKKVKGTVSKSTQDEMQNAQFAARAVEPHRTQSGFHVLRVSGISTPLAGAHILPHRCARCKGNELMYFRNSDGKISERAPASKGELVQPTIISAMAQQPPRSREL